MVFLDGTSSSSRVFASGVKKVIDDESTEWVVSVKGMGLDGCYCGVGWMSMAGIDWASCSSSRFVLN